MDILWSRWVQIWQIYPPGTEISQSRWVQIWQIYHLIGSDILTVMMRSNLADLPLDLLADQIYPLVLTSCGQDEIKYGRSTPLVVTSHSHDEVKFGRSTPRSAGWSIPPVLTSCGQDEFKYGRSTPLVVTSHSDVEVKFGRSTPRSAGRSNPWYWHLVVKVSSNLADLPLDLLTDLPPVLTSFGQDDLKFGRSTPRSAVRSTPVVLKCCGQDEFKFGRSTPRYAVRSIPAVLTSHVVKMSSNLADLPLW